MNSSELFQTIASVRKVLAVVVTGNRYPAALTLICNVFVSVLPAALAYTSRTIIDSLLLVGTVGAAGAAAAASGMPAPVWLAGVYVILLVAQQAGQSVLLLANETLTEAGARNIHSAVIATGVRLEGVARFESPAFHDRRMLLERNALYLPMNGLRFVSDLLSIGITMISMAVLLSGLHVLIPLVMIAFALPDVLSQIKAHRLRYEGLNATAEPERLGRITSDPS